MDIATLASKIQLCYSTSDLEKVETSLSMSTLDITEMTGSRHDNVKTALQTLVNSEIVVVPARQDRQFLDSLGRARSEEAYVLDERSSLILVAVISPRFTAALVDQWLALRKLVADQRNLIAKQAAQIAAQEKRELQNTLQSLTFEKAFLSESIKKLERASLKWYEKLDMPMYTKHLAALEAISEHYKAPSVFKNAYNDIVVDFSEAQMLIRELDVFINKHTKIGSFLKERPNTLEILSIHHNKL